MQGGHSAYDTRKRWNNSPTCPQEKFLKPKMTVGCTEWQDSSLIPSEMHDGSTAVKSGLAKVADMVWGGEAPFKNIISL